MNRYGYLDYRKLEVGDQVSWEHPVTGKVYDFDVIEVDLKDKFQPVRLRLLDEVDYPNIVNVSEYAEFGYRGAKCWVYKSLEAHKDRYGFEPEPNSITLDRLFYTSMHHVPKSAETKSEDTKSEDFGECRIQGELALPSADEVYQYRYTSQADFQKMFVEQLAEAIKRNETYIKLSPVLIEMYRDELINLGYQVYYDVVHFAKFD